MRIPLLPAFGPFVASGSAGSSSKRVATNWDVDSCLIVAQVHLQHFGWLQEIAGFPLLTPKNCNQAIRTP